jgi:hypothetical protein
MSPHHKAANPKKNGRKRSRSEEASTSSSAASSDEEDYDRRARKSMKKSSSFGNKSQTPSKSTSKRPSQRRDAHSDEEDDDDHDHDEDDNNEDVNDSPIRRGGGKKQGDKKKSNKNNKSNKNKSQKSGSTVPGRVQIVETLLGEAQDLLYAAAEAQTLGRLKMANSYLVLAHARLVGVGKRSDRQFLLQLGTAGGGGGAPCRPVLRRGHCEDDSNREDDVPKDTKVPVVQQVATKEAKSDSSSETDEDYSPDTDAEARGNGSVNQTIKAEVDQATHPKLTPAAVREGSSYANGEETVSSDEGESSDEELIHDDDRRTAISPGKKPRADDHGEHYVNGSDIGEDVDGRKPDNINARAQRDFLSPKDADMKVQEAKRMAKRSDSSKDDRAIKQDHEQKEKTLLAKSTPCAPAAKPSSAALQGDDYDESDEESFHDAESTLKPKASQQTQIAAESAKKTDEAPPEGVGEEEGDKEANGDETGNDDDAAKTFASLIPQGITLDAVMMEHLRKAAMELHQKRTGGGGDAKKEARALPPKPKAPMAWTDGEKQRCYDAVDTFGRNQTSDIARAVGTRTEQQVIAHLRNASDKARASRVLDHELDEQHHGI